jgi:hypothetical protein
VTAGAHQVPHPTTRALGACVDRRPASSTHSTRQRPKGGGEKNACGQAALHVSRASCDPRVATWSFQGAPPAAPSRVVRVQQALEPRRTRYAPGQCCWTRCRWVLCVCSLGRLLESNRLCSGDALPRAVRQAGASSVGAARGRGAISQLAIARCESVAVADGAQLFRGPRTSAAFPRMQKHRLAPSLRGALWTSHGLSCRVGSCENTMVSAAGQPPDLIPTTAC